MSANPQSEHILELDSVSKFFGSVIALKEVTMRLRRGRCTASSATTAPASPPHQDPGRRPPPTAGTYRIDGEPVVFRSPRDALDRGIATVYQDLALVPLMSVARNFVMGREPMRRRYGVLRVLDQAEAARIASEKLADMGIAVRDLDQAVGTMSGGERQCLAIARAIHFGARVLILDEPTAAWG